MTEITQADKNRADQWLDRPSDTPARKSERDRLAHKFARHREQAEQETVAKIVAWLREQQKNVEQARDDANEGDLEWHLLDEHASAIEQSADAIEAGEWK